LGSPLEKGFGGGIYLGNEVGPPPKRGLGPQVKIPREECFLREVKGFYFGGRN